MSLVALPAPGASEAGDEVAEVADGGFEDLYRQYAARVEALAWRRLHDRHAAEDAVQETFLRAYRSFGRIDADRPVWPWLRTIATNVCVDMLRLRRHPDRDGSLSDGDADLGPASPAKSDPGEVHLAAQRRRSIATALAAVNPRQRRVVILRDVEGWENEEVAQLEGITLDAVKSALKRGRQTFRSTYLALADRNGLLGGLLVGAGGLMGRFRRLALRVRAGGEASTGFSAVAPLAQLLPLAIVATLAGGVVAAQDQASQAPAHAPAQTLQNASASVRDVPSDALVSRGLGSSADAATVRPTTPDVPGSGVRVLNPLGDNKDVNITSALERDERRTTVITKVVVDQAPEPVPPIEDTFWMDCNTPTAAKVCDAVENVYATAPEGEPTP